jgi:hypothetical protein
LPHRGVIFAALLLLLSLALAAAGCKGKSGQGGATATSTATRPATALATSTRAPAGTATPAPDIRQEDFSKLPGVHESIASGNKIDTAAIIYADVTEDGVDDAVVPISTGGEGGDIAVFVFGYGPAGLTELLRVSATGVPVKVTVTNGVVQGDIPEYAPGDPFCCPSNLHRTTYKWDGTQLVVAKQETVPGAAN